MSRPRSVTDEQIKQAARDVFLEHGPAAPVSMIASKLGVSHAAIFGRAGSKEQLLIDALCPGHPRAAGWLSEPPPTHDVALRLIEILEDLMTFFVRVVPGLVVLRAAGLSIEDLPSSGGEAPPVVLRRMLASWLDAASESGCFARPLATEALAEGLLGAMEARCFNAYVGGESFAPGDDATFVGDLVRGLLPLDLQHTHGEET